MIFDSSNVRDEYYSSEVELGLRRFADWINDLFWCVAGLPACLTNILANHGSTVGHSEGRMLDVKTTGPGVYASGVDVIVSSPFPYISAPKAMKIAAEANKRWSTGARFPSGKEMLFAINITAEDIRDGRREGNAPHIHFQKARGLELRRR